MLTVDVQVEHIWDDKLSRAEWILTQLSFLKKIGSNIMRMYLSINDISAGETDAMPLKIFKFVRKITCKARWKKNGAFLVYGTDCNYIYCLKFFLHFVCIDLLLAWLLLKKYMYIFINSLLENK